MKPARDSSHAKRAARGPRAAYRASYLTPKGGSASLEYHADALMIVDAAGVIEALVPATGEAPRPPDFRGVVHDLRPALVVPAFVDVHLHAPQTRAIGSATGPLLDWLEKTVFPEEERFADADYADEVCHDFVDHCVAAGTGTVGVFSSSSPASTAVLLDTMLAQGIRGVAGLTLMDQRCPDALRVDLETAERAMTELADRFHRADEGRIELAVTPRFAISCSRKMMELAGRIARDRGLVVQTHVAENLHEGSETLTLYPWASDYLDVYDKVGLLGPKTILAHAIHLTPSEWDRLADRRATIAHCPDSNFFLGSGRMRLSMARERSVRVGLGTDVGAGRSFDMRRAIAYAHDNALAVGEARGPDELFRLATLGGAEALGLDAVTGSIEVGKEADFAVLRLPSHLHGREGALRAACFGSDFARVERTYVRGRLVHRAGMRD